MTGLSEAGRAGRMLRHLKAAGDAGVCLSDVDGLDAYCARNAIATLRKLGFRIDSAPCRAHGHRGRIARYCIELSATTEEGVREASSTTRPNGAIAKTEDLLSPKASESSTGAGGNTPALPGELFPVYERRGAAL